MEKCVDDPHFATQFSSGLPYWQNTLFELESITKEVEGRIKIRLKEDPKSINVTWINDEVSFIDEWESFIST